MKVKRQFKKMAQTRRIMMLSAAVGLLFISFFLINPLQLSQFAFEEKTADYATTIITPSSLTLTNIMDSRGDERLPVPIKIEIIEGEIGLERAVLMHGSTELAEKVFTDASNLIIESPEAFVLVSALIYEKGLGDTWSESFEFTIFVYLADEAHTENYETFRITIDYQLAAVFELEPPVEPTTTDLPLPIAQRVYVPEWEPPMELMIGIGTFLIASAIIIIMLKNRR